MSPAVRLLRTYSIPLTLPPSLKAYSRQVQWPLFRRFHSVRLVYLCPPSLSFSPSVYGYVCAVCFGVSNDFISPVVDLWLSRTVQERGGGGVCVGGRESAIGLFLFSEVFCTLQGSTASIFILLGHSFACRLSSGPPFPFPVLRAHLCTDVSSRWPLCFCVFLFPSLHTVDDDIEQQKRACGSGGT